MILLAIYLLGFAISLFIHYRYYIDGSWLKTDLEEKQEAWIFSLTWPASLPLILFLLIVFYFIKSVDAVLRRILP